jgi:hypothetical protein
MSSCRMKPEKSQVTNGVRILADLGRHDLIGLGGFLSEVNESIPSASRLPGSKAGAIRDRAVY